MAKQSVQRSRFAAAFACLLVSCGSCDPLGIQKAIESANAAFKQSLERLDRVVSEQREALTEDVQGTLSATMSDLSVLSNQVAVAAGVTQEATMADVSKVVADATAAVDRLTYEVRAGSADGIKRASDELRHNMDRAFASVRNTIDQARPLLAQAERVGDKLVMRVADETTVLTVRIFAGAIALVCAIGLVILLVRKAGAAKLAVAGGVLLAAGGVLAAAAPLVKGLNPREMTALDPEATCKAMSTEGAQLRALLQHTTRDRNIAVTRLSPGLRASVGGATFRFGLVRALASPGGPAFAPTPAAGASAEMVARLTKAPEGEELVAAVRGGARRKLAAQVESFRTTGALSAMPSATAKVTRAAGSPPTDDEVTALATRVRDSAIACAVYTSSPALAAESQQHLALASSYLGLPVVCASDSQCNPPRRCDASTAECLPLGVFCREPAHCDRGSECDASLLRCVASASYSCSPAKPCRPGELCLAGSCRDANAIVGQACVVETAEGPCRQGTYQLAVNGQLLCRSAVAARPETCDGVDNDCNGEIDDVHADVLTACRTSGKGECAAGRYRCTAGSLVCQADRVALPDACDGRDNDCNGFIDDGPPCTVAQEGDPGMAMSIAILGTSVQNQVAAGRLCSAGKIRHECTARITQGAGTCTPSWKSADPHDCTCVATLTRTGPIAACELKAMSKKEPLKL